MKIHQLIFGISATETQFSKRGFKPVSEPIQNRLETIGATFVFGYNHALLNDHIPSLSKTLDSQPVELRGFAYEGAAMALTILDFISPWNRSRIQRFLDTTGNPHTYMVYVGIGWAWARLHRNIDKAVKNLDPLLGWLAVDGYGFHEGYFNWRKSIVEQIQPLKLSTASKEVFDQGLGRSLWFVKGADIDAINQTIKSFPKNRRANLWGGIGLAATYAGGVSAKELNKLQQYSGDFSPQLAQGAAFAAKARIRADNPTEQLEQACQIFCQSNAVDAAMVTDKALNDLVSSQGTPYQLWQKRIQNKYCISA